MIKIKQYGETTKFFYFVFFVEPLVILFSFMPEFEERFNPSTFLIMNLIGLSLFVCLFIIARRKSIAFDDKKIQVFIFGKMTRTYTWQQLLDIKMNYRMAIERYHLSFDDGYVLLFEASGKEIHQVFDICPVNDIKEKMRYFDMK